MNWWHLHVLLLLKQLLSWHRRYKTHNLAPTSIVYAHSQHRHIQISIWVLGLVLWICQKKTVKLQLLQLHYRKRFTILIRPWLIWRICMQCISKYLSAAYDYFVSLVSDVSCRLILSVHFYNAQFLLLLVILMFRHNLRSIKVGLKKSQWERISATSHWWETTDLVILCRRMHDLRFTPLLWFTHVVLNFDFWSVWFLLLLQQNKLVDSLLTVL